MKLLKANYSVLILALLGSFAGHIVAGPVGAAFTYQGRHREAGQPANGYYDLRFKLYDAATGDGLVMTTFASTIVTNGSFTVVLDFGAVFNGQARWLEIGVRTHGSSGSYSTPTTRQQLTPTPYALYAASAASAATASSFDGNLSGDVTGT